LRFKYLLFVLFITNNTQKIHRRYTEDAQIVLFEYGVGIAQTENAKEEMIRLQSFEYGVGMVQTQTKAMCNRIRKRMRYIAPLIATYWN